MHRAGALFDESEFTGDENAIVDFKYSSSPRITWWFDHHLSAFLTPRDQQNFLDCQKDPICGAHKFFDPDYTSCTSFLAHIASTLFIPRLIPLLTELPLAEVLRQPFVAELLAPLLERHQQALELIRARSEERDGTIFFDITDHPTEGFNKFIPYYLHPNAVYSIGLSRSSFRTKVAVGSNPWTKEDPATMVNLASVCERYGGGGHARVGAISFPPDQGDRAREAAAEIVAELRAHQLKK